MANKICWWNQRTEMTVTIIYPHFRTVEKRKFITKMSSLSKEARRNAPIFATGLMSAMGLGYLYTKRTEYLADPVLQRALMHLEKDQRVLDFCGETIKPGWLITREIAPGENWVKYSLTVSGSSGKLSTTLIGDYMEHGQLLDLEQDR